jgi:hypothetical protein
LPYIRNLVKRVQTNVIIIAYRGYSDSIGQPTEEGLMIDAKAILSFAFTHDDLDKEKIFIYGRSLGGAVGVYVS